MQPIRQYLDQIAPISVAIGIISVICLGSAVLFFASLASVISLDKLPAGVSHWTTCVGGGRTALGQVLPLSYVRGLVSGGKLAINVLIATFLAKLTVGQKRSVVVLVVAILETSIAVGGFVLVIQPAAPPWIDGCVSAMQLLVLVVCLCSVPEQRRGKYDCLFFGNLFGVIIVMIILINLFAILVDPRYNVGTATAVGVACTASRLFDFFARFVFKMTGGSVRVCSAILYLYEANLAFLVRRFFFRQSSIPELLGASLMTFAVEIGTHACATWWAVKRYNRMLQGGQRDEACRHFNLFISVVLADMVAEHVGLTISLGFSLTYHPLIFDIEVIQDTNTIWKVWLVQVFIEVIADLVSLWFIFGILPLKSTHLMDQTRGHKDVLCFLFVTSAFVYLPGLHNNIAVHNFVC